MQQSILYLQHLLKMSLMQLLKISRLRFEKNSNINEQIYFLQCKELLSEKRLIHLISTLSLLMLSDSELFKRTSHIYVAAFSRSVHIKNTSVNEHLLDPARFKSLKLTLSFLAIPLLDGNQSVLYTCVYIYIRTPIVTVRTRIYLHYVHSCFFLRSKFHAPLEALTYTYSIVSRNLRDDVSSSYRSPKRQLRT